VGKAVCAAFGRRPLPSWAYYHPHFRFPRSQDSINNTVYVARKQLALPGTGGTKIPGGGVFPRFCHALCLTALRRQGTKRSVWQLPEWFHPKGRKSSLSYHDDSERWKKSRGRVLLESVARGQEFVLDCGDYPEAPEWAGDIIGKRTS
jgi:putative DNA base modification enzyme with NMAD domain